MGFQRVLFLSVLAVAAMFFLARSAVAANDIRMEPLPDGVKHWHRIGEEEQKPYFYKLMEDVYHVFVTDADKLPFGKSVAFLVGVGNYAHLSPQLDFVQNDLAALREYLLSKGGFDSVYVAEGDIVDANLVEDYLFNKFRRILGRDDRLLFYYSGHGDDLGGTTGYMQFSKARRGQYDRNQILAIRNAVEWSRILPAKHALFIFDCCVSGLAFTSKGGKDPKRQILETLSGNGSRTIITAGTADEETFGIEGRHSVFTKAFLDALMRPQSHHGFLTMNEVFADIELRVKNFSRQYGKSVTPRRWELQEDRYRGAFLFMDPESAGEGLPEEWVETMGAKSKGTAVRRLQSYGSVQLIALVSGSVFIDGAPYGPITKGDGLEYGPFITGPHEIEIRGKIGAYNESFVIEKGKSTRVIIRPEATTTVARDPQPSRVDEKRPFTNDLGMTFVYIPPDTFMMGSPEDEPGRDDDEKQHKVTLTKGFYLQTTEVTQGQWKAVMGDNPSNFKNCGDDCPVESVSWKDVQAFIEKLNRREGKTYRLPTEAEWEYAGRSGGADDVYAGISNVEELDQYANFCDKNCDKNWKSNSHDDGYKNTAPVASLKPNRIGLYDMSGNVWEWCADWYGDYPGGSVTDPTGPSSGSDRVFRGGSWDGGARGCRSAFRGGGVPGNRDDFLGFRLARSLEP